MKEPEVIQIGYGTHYMTRGIHEKALCRQCLLPLVDSESAQATGEYWHYRGKNPCVNDGKYLKWDEGELLPIKRKGVRRAMARGAKLASKHRGK